MGAQLQCGYCTREGLPDLSHSAQDSLLCRRPCGLDELEANFASCDPAGTVFSDTLQHLHECDRTTFSFAGSSNLAALRWRFVFGADLKACDSNGTTLLHVACRTGSFQTVKDLVLRGADVNAADCAVWSPLHVASCMGRQDVTLYLLQSGAKPHCKNSRGQTPEDLCSHPCTKEVVVGYDERMAKPSQVGFPTRSFRGSGDGGSSAFSETRSIHFEPFFVPRDPLLVEPRHREDLQLIGVQLFNRSPGNGVAFLVALGVVRDFPVEINNFLIRVGASPEQLGEYLAEDCPIAQTLRLEFLNSLPLLGTGVVTALETALHEMTMPSDWLKVDRLTRGIAHFWWRQHEEELSERRAEGASSSTPPRNPSSSSGGELMGLELQRSLLGTDALHRLLFSTLMLHRWMQEGNQMTLNEWVQLNMGIEGFGNDVPLHVQMGIYKVMAEGQAALDDASTKQPAKSLEPTLECLAHVRYNGRPPICGDGEPAQWPEASPFALAEQGGVLSAGRMSPLPLHAAKEPLAPSAQQRGVRKKRGVAGALAQPFDAGSGSGSGHFNEEATWLRLHHWLLLLAPGPDSTPYAFVSLKRVAILRADAGIRQLVLVSRAEVDVFGMEDDWLELCLLLGDGRFQQLEAPELVLRFADDTEYQHWASYLKELCSDDVERRNAALNHKVTAPSTPAKGNALQMSGWPRPAQQALEPQLSST